MTRRCLAAAVAAVFGLTSSAALAGSSPSAGSPSPVSVAPVSFASPFVEIAADGMAPVYGRAADGEVGEVWPMGGDVEFRTFTAGTWTSAARLASLPVGLSVRSATAAVGVNFLGNLEVYVVASDAQVWHSYAAAGASNWSAFAPLGAPVVAIAGGVSVGTNYLGNQEMYVRTTDGQVFHQYATPGQGSGWSGWDSMGRPAAGVRGDVGVGKNSFGNEELFIVGNDARPYHNFATPGIGSGWNGWDPVDGAVAPVGDVSVGINYFGEQELYFVGGDGNIWHNYATPGSGSGWVGWSPLGAPPGGAAAGDVAVQPPDFAVLGTQWIRVVAREGLVWQDTQTPGAGSGWSPWSSSSVPLPAVVSGVLPDSGSTAGGTSVTVTGAGFTGATAVNFGASTGTALTVNSATSITVTSPAGAAGAVDVTVSGFGGTSTVVAAARYTFVTPPDTTPPAAVTGLSASVATWTSLALSWTNPTDPDFAGVVIRRALGNVAPGDDTAGEFVADLATSATSFTDTGLTPSTHYSYALFAHDSATNYSGDVAVSGSTLVIPSTGLFGTVTATGGQAAVGVTVHVYPANPPAATPAMPEAMPEITPAVTLAGGTYMMSAELRPYTPYRICFDGSSATVPGTAAGEALALPAALAPDCVQRQFTLAPNKATQIDDLLGVAGGISGTVTDGGSPVGGVVVAVTPVISVGTTNAAITATTASDGTYLIKGVPAGDYTACFDGTQVSGDASPGGYYDQCFGPAAGGTPIAVSAGMVSGGVDAHVIADLTKGAIAGVVTGAGGVLQNIRVTVESTDGLTVYSTTTTGAEGTYRATGIPAGTGYSVGFAAVHEGGALPATTGGSSETGYAHRSVNDVDVIAMEVTAAVDGNMPAAGAISGTVTATAGSPVAGVLVSAVGVDIPHYSSSAVTAADGSYRVVDLTIDGASEFFGVCFAPSGPSSISPNDYVGECFDQTDSPLVFPGRALQDNPVLMAGGFVAGRVTDSSGNPLENVSVEVVASAASSVATRMVTTAPDGTYVAGGLAAGTYSVCFDAANASGGVSTTGYVGECYNNLPTSATPLANVSVTLGLGTVGADAVLRAGP